jgi:NH3-dependent NAD+ synthetase
MRPAIVTTINTSEYIQGFITFFEYRSDGTIVYAPNVLADTKWTETGQRIYPNGI